MAHALAKVVITTTSFVDQPSRTGVYQPVSLQVCHLPYPPPLSRPPYTCILQVLALQALQPLLLVSADASNQHSSSIAALLTDTHTPPALLLQAVSTAGALVSTRPAQSSVLVQHLEQLLLTALTAVAPGCSSSPRGCSSLGGLSARMGDGDTGTPAGSTAACDGEKEEEDAEVVVNAAKAAAAGAREYASLCAAAVAAAGWYCQLLLSEKLLLTGYSWGLVAEGLLAQGPLQVGVAAAWLCWACLWGYPSVPCCRNWGQVQGSNRLGSVCRQANRACIQLAGIYRQSSRHKRPWQVRIYVKSHVQV